MPGVLNFWEVRDEGVVAPRSSSSRTQKRGASAHSSSHDTTSATQMSGIFASSSTNSKETHALPETFKELKTRSASLVSFAIPVHVSHHNPFLTLAAHPRWRKAQTLQKTQQTAKPLSCLFVCHPHLTSIIALTAVWAQPCGLEHKTSLSFSCIFGSFSSATVFLYVLCRLVAHRQALCTTSVNSAFPFRAHCGAQFCVRAFSDSRLCDHAHWLKSKQLSEFHPSCWCVGGSSTTILPLLVQIVRIHAVATSFGWCAYW